VSNNKIPSVRLNRSLKWSIISSLNEILPYDGKEKINNAKEPIRESLMEELKILFPEEEMNIVKKYRPYYEVNGWNTPKSFVVVSVNPKDARRGYYGMTFKHVIFSNSVELPYYMCGYINNDKLDKTSFSINSGSVELDHPTYESKTNLSDLVEEYLMLLRDRDDKLKTIIPVYRKIVERSRTVSGLISELPEIKDEVFRVLRISPCVGSKKTDNSEDDDMKKLLMFREKNGIQADAV